MAGSAEEVNPLRKRNQKKKKREDGDSEEDARKYKMRILKRKTTNADFHYRTDWLTCWTAGNAPVCVGPPKIEEGIRCILVSPNAKWLKELSLGHKTWQHTDNTYIACVVSKLKDIVRTIKPNPLDLGGVALREDHSSNETESDTEAGGPNRYREKPQWLTITVNDEGDSLKVLAKRGNGIFIEYIGEAITLICSLVHQSRRFHEADASPDPSRLLMPADEGKITYNLRKKAYRVTYTPKKGPLGKTNPRCRMEMLHRLCRLREGIGIIATPAQSSVTSTASCES